MRETRELKACTSCGHQRKVLVYKYNDSKDDFWNKLCTPCALLVSVVRHRHTANRLEARARQILTKRRQNPTRKTT